MQRFQYSPLAPDCIRLITLLPQSTSSEIRCTLSHHTYDEARQDYVALSYCWGDPNPIFNITMNGQVMKISRNLYSWFKAIQSTSIVSISDGLQGLEKRTFWIDAICINQTDIPERNAQVQQMWRVYNSASSVLAWLGPPTPLLTQAMELAMSLDDNTSSDFEEAAISRICDGLNSSGYFDRVWIVPEILRGVFRGGVSLMTGSLLLDWETIVLYCDEGPRRSELSARGCRNLVSLIMREDESRFVNHYDKISRFILHLRALSSRQCSDRRDKIFALLALPQMQDALDNLPAGSPGLVVDYNISIMDLFITTVAFVEQIDRRDQRAAEPHYSRHTEALETISSALEVDVLRVQEYLRAQTTDWGIRLASGKRVDAGPILLDLLGDGILLREKKSSRGFRKDVNGVFSRLFGKDRVEVDEETSSVDGWEAMQAYDEFLVQRYGPQKWRIEERNYRSSDWYHMDSRWHDDR